MFKRILVPLDRSPLAEQALDIAAEIARASNATLDLVFAHERALGMSADDAFDIRQREDEDRYLESIAAEMLREHELRATHTVIVGTPDATIALRAQDIGADIVVMTSHGRTGWNRAWLGSVADGVVRKSTVPVLMLRVASGDLPRGSLRPVLRRILVPLDGSPLAASMLAHVIPLARSLQSRITLFRVVRPTTIVVPPIGADAIAPVTIEDAVKTRYETELAATELERNAAFLAEQGCADVEHRVMVSSDPADAIVDCIRYNDIDVVAMSTHGRGASRLLVGSVADKVLKSTGAAVMLNRPSATLRDATIPQAPQFSTAS